MDTSDKYIKMSAHAFYEIQEPKYKSGFEESDFVWDGKRVRVVGHDFLSIKRNSRDSRSFYFAILENDGFSVQSDISTAMVCHSMEGKYRFDILANPIWLPRQDQLADKIVRLHRFCDGAYGNVLDKLMTESVHWRHRNSIGDQDSRVDTLEQIYLSIYMFYGKNRIWSNNIYTWIDSE
jgi:hypothetical protein